MNFLLFIQFSFFTIVSIFISYYVRNIINKKPYPYLKVHDMFVNNDINKLYSNNTNINVIITGNISIYNIYFLYNRYI